MMYEEYINGPRDDEDEDDDGRRSDDSGSHIQIEIYDPTPEKEDED